MVGWWWWFLASFFDVDRLLLPSPQFTMHYNHLFCGYFGNWPTYLRAVHCWLHTKSENCSEALSYLSVSVFLLWGYLALWLYGNRVYHEHTCSKWIGIRSTGRHYVFIYQVNNFGMTNKSQTFSPLIFKFWVYRRCGVHVFTLRVKRFRETSFRRNEIFVAVATKWS